MNSRRPSSLSTPSAWMTRWFSRRVISESPMTVVGLSEQYKSALMDYLAQPGDGALERAYELGRRVVASDLGILEVAASHQEVLESLLARSLSPEDQGRLSKSTDFLLQCLSPFEMAHRGVKESNATLHRLHHTLEQH